MNFGELTISKIIRFSCIFQNEFKLGHFRVTKFPGAISSFSHHSEARFLVSTSIHVRKFSEKIATRCTCICFVENTKTHKKMLLTKAFMFNVRRNGRLCVSTTPLLKFIYGLEAYFLQRAFAYHPAMFHFTSISSSYAIPNIHCNTHTHTHICTYTQT